MAERVGVSSSVVVRRWLADGRRGAVVVGRSTRWLLSGAIDFVGGWKLSRFHVTPSDVIVNICHDKPHETNICHDNHHQANTGKRAHSEEIKFSFLIPNINHLPIIKILVPFLKSPIHGSRSSSIYP